MQRIEQKDRHPVHPYVHSRVGDDRKSPDLLRKRLDAKEKQTEQKTMVSLSGLMFIAAFILTLSYIPIIHKRMTNEESILSEGLEGYKEYIQKVEYRIVPFIY